MQRNEKTNKIFKKTCIFYVICNILLHEIVIIYSNQKIFIYKMTNFKKYSFFSFFKISPKKLDVMKIFV